MGDSGTAVIESMAEQNAAVSLERRPLQDSGNTTNTADASTSAPATTASGGKYVPPHKRRTGGSGDTPSNRAGGGGGDEHPAPSGGFGRRPFAGAGGGGDRPVADRWKAIDPATSGPGPDNRSFFSGGERRNQRTDWGGDEDGGSKPYHNRASATGTGWDVRDGRRYRQEDEDEIFKKDKDKSTGINFDSYENIPVDVSGPRSTEVVAIGSFRDAHGVHALLAANIQRVKYEKPTPIQKYSIPAILAGRDLMACAQTGSGKTAAFLFPIITKMLHSGPPAPPPASRNRMRLPAYPVALVLSPTRELAIQIYEESRKFSFGTGIRTVVVYGGSEVRTQVFELDWGCDVCVATPGRLSDLIERARIRLRLIKYLVLDEADRMLDMGFAPQIHEIVERTDMPTSQEGRQTVMFSATFPNEIQQLARDFLHEYIYLTVGRVGSTNEFIKQQFVFADEGSKPKKLLTLLREVKGLTLVFVETKKRADMIEQFLQDNDFRAVSIHGDRSQQEREDALRAFRTGERTILVATDVAARGLDIHNIAHVINCDLPNNIDDYVHRIGRTGRAGNVGLATSFVNEQNRPILRDLHGLLEEAKQEVPTWLPVLVGSCTSSSRKFGSAPRYGGGGSRGGRGGGGRPTFGSRDIRSGEERYTSDAGSRAGARSMGGGVPWRSNEKSPVNGFGNHQGSSAHDFGDDDGW